MPRLPRLTASEAERLLFSAGFTQLRSKGSHRIYFKEGVRVVVPFHASKVLHPKIVKQVMAATSSDDSSKLDKTISEDIFSVTDDDCQDGDLGT